MLPTLLNAAQRLAEALDAENQALAALDLTRAAALASAKIRATDAFAAACAAARKLGTETRDAVVEDMTARLQSLGAENRRLLERAIGLQSRVIETIAGAALPHEAPPGYGASGNRRVPAKPPALTLSTRI